MTRTENKPLIYVLITPARNEAAFIEKTLKSMICQTRRPLRWVIVSDGSTDGTDEIVQRYAAQERWIELIRMPERRERHFAGKVLAFNAGYARVKDLDFDIVGNLDGDISFDRDYFAFLVGKFEAHPDLGVGGTAFTEGSHRSQYDYRFTSIEHVSGQCQMFRRACYESIGGYVPREVGGIDLVAVLTARMKGWQTRTFPEKTFEHHRRMGSGMNRGLMVTFKSGYHDYLMGVHPLWQLFRSIYQMKNRPVAAGGLVLLAGYCWALVKRVDRPVSPELIAFRKKEQMQRLRDLFRSLLHRGRPGAGQVSRT